MKTRFRKVWCSSCSSMQFAGECPHPLRAAHTVAPPFREQVRSITAADHFGQRYRTSQLIMPEPTSWRLYPYRRCSCPLCLGGEKRC